jgi:hypothetical protein
MATNKTQERRLLLGMTIRISRRNGFKGEKTTDQLVSNVPVYRSQPELDSPCGGKTAAGTMIQSARKK